MTIYLTYLQINSYYIHGYNYGLGYIAAFLKLNGINVKYFPIWKDEDLENFYENINLENPEIIGFSATSSQFPFLKEITKKIKSFSNSFLICGGAHTTLQPESINQIPEMDAIAIGEGEYAMLDLANAILNKTDFTHIKNLWVRSGNEIIKNPVRPLIENLNSLPFPDKDCTDYQQILDKSKGNNRFIFSRGCTFKCSYCSNEALSSVYPNKKKYYRFIEPELAIEQIKIDQARYKFNKITFDDDTISLNKKWFFTFFDLYKKNFSYPFRCNLRIETVNEEVIKLLKEAGASNIGIGLEHGNEEFRRNVLNRKMSNQQIKNVFDLVNKYKITHDDFLMVGFPEENRKLFFDTVKLAREVGAKGKPSIFQPYPSTELASICETNNWMPKKEIYKERYEAVIDFPEFKKEDIQLSAGLFPFLLKYKFLPLLNITIYLQILLYISKTQNYLFNFYRRVNNKLKFYSNKFSSKTEKSISEKPIYFFKNSEKISNI